MLNHSVIMGRLTKDPELRHTQQGTPVASFTIACERDYSSGGNKQTDFFDCVAWRNTAEFASKYFSKGRMAVVDGRLQMRDWQDKDGNKRRAIEILVENIYFADSKNSNANTAASDNAGGFAPLTPGDFAVVDDEDGELPF